jgi:predicted permease
MMLWQDIRFAARLLVKDPWFTLAAASALALGIGANAAVFTFVNAVLLRGLPFDNPDRIISVGNTDPRGRQLGVSYLDFADWREQSRTMASLSAGLGSTINVSDEGKPPEQFQGSYVSGNTFQMIGQRPLIGRDFTDQDDRVGADPVVILGNGIWKNRYGSDSAIIGRTIRANSLIVTVIGVMPPDMKFPLNAELWIPRAQLPAETRDAVRAVRSFNIAGRLRPDATLQQAQAEFAAIGKRLADTYPASNKDIKPDLMKFNDRINGGPIRTIFLALMGAVAFVLLIACANVANLLLARSAQRAREISVRVALGASRWRIIRQLLVESLLLAAIAGAVGLVLAIGGIRWFDIATADVGKPYWIKFTMDRTVLAFMAAVCLGTAVLFGLAPALHVSKTDVNDVLKEGGRGGTAGIRARRWAGVLIVVELVLTVVLLAGAGFMMQGFLTLYRLDLGIDTSHLLTMRLYLPLTKYPQPGPRAALYQQFEDRLIAIPAIQESALASNTPLGGGFRRLLTIEARPPSAGVSLPEVTALPISDGYFSTLGIKLSRGRMLASPDGLPGHEAAVVNQRFVAMHFTNEDPLGRRITLTNEDPSVAPVAATIVGVAPTIRQRGVQERDPDPVVYLPYRADPQRGMALIVRTNADPASVTASVRDAMRTIEPDLPLFNIQTLDQVLAQQRWTFRIFGSMFAVFAGIALVLAAVGLYAVTAYSVAQRTQEIGIRMALGALPRSVMWLVLKRALVQLAIGLPIGLAGAYGVGQVLQSLLVQTSPSDPVILGSITAVLATVAVAACLWPARRAARLDPMLALRYE